MEAVALERGSRHCCFVVLEKGRNEVGGFGMKCLKGVARFGTRPGRGQGGCQANEAVVASLMVGFAALSCTVAEARDTNWDGDDKCRRSLGGYIPAFVGRGTIVSGR